jgi:hypothetical protein
MASELLEFCHVDQPLIDMLHMPNNAREIKLEHVKDNVMVMPRIEIDECSYHDTEMARVLRTVTYLCIPVFLQPEYYKETQLVSFNLSFGYLNSEVMRVKPTDKAYVFEYNVGRYIINHVTVAMTSVSNKRESQMTSLVDVQPGDVLVFPEFVVGMFPYLKSLTDNVVEQLST